MNILLLNYEYPPLGGGAANATYHILREFSGRNDMKIDLVTSSTGSFRKEFFSENIQIHFLDIGKKGNLHYQSNKNLLDYSRKAYSYATKLKKTQRYHLVHAFFGIPCGYLALKLKLPYIVSLRGSDVPFYNLRFKVLDRLVFRRLSRKIWKNAQATIANSEGLRQLAQVSAPHQAIEVIHNGVDTTFFRPKQQKQKSSVLRLISTGRLIKRKGFHFLIQALKGLDNVELRLLGGGNQQNELRALAKTTGAKVFFEGKKSRGEVARQLQQADLFVLPSLNEGMSNSILEAMASGLPVIATDVGGSSELIRGNGVVVPKASAKALHEAIRFYLENPAQITHQATLSRKRAETFSWQRVAAQYLAVYEKCHRK